MATALAAPTGTQIINLFPYESGAAVTIGALTLEAIDNHISNEGASSVVNIAYQYVNTLLTNAGYTTSALDDTTEYPYAWRALRWICVYELLKLDMEMRACLVRQGDKGFNRAEYEAKMMAAVQAAAGQFAKLGINDTKYYRNPFSDDFINLDTVDRCFDKYYNPNESNN